MTLPPREELYRTIADRLVADPDIGREDVQVILTPKERVDRLFGNGVFSYPPSPDKA